MTDRELLDALTVLTRRLGLLDPGERLAVESVRVPDAPRDDALCLVPGERKGLRLLCNYARGHRNMATGDVVHSWTNAPVGMSACIARTPGTLDANLLCELPTHHTGEHKATGADGVRWTWGGALDHCGLCGSEACPGVLGKGCMPGPFEAYEPAAS